MPVRSLTCVDDDGGVARVPYSSITTTLEAPTAHSHMGPHSATRGAPSHTHAAPQAPITHESHARFKGGNRVVGPAAASPSGRPLSRGSSGTTFTVKSPAKPSKCVVGVVMPAITLGSVFVVFCVHLLVTCNPLVNNMF